MKVYKRHTTGVPNVFLANTCEIMKEYQNNLACYEMIIWGRNLEKQRDIQAI